MIYPSKENVCDYLVKNCRVSEREGGAVEMKVITPGKIVPHKCCLPNWNISLTKDFYVVVLFHYVFTHFQVLSVIIH